MTEVLVHRGPDESGQRLAPGVALGIRRLSIIDVAASHQPLANEDSSVWTVFNGEIYNFAELRAGLRRRGHRLSTAGDTETIVHLYEDEGAAFPHRLEGMFGIAIWDERRRRLVLARDRMGVKPLYYAVGEWGIAFASEVKSLLACGLLQPRLDPAAAELYLAYGYLPGPRTLFEGVRKLAPAHTLIWENGQQAGDPQCYWEPWEERPDGADRSWAHDEEEFLALLKRSVRDHLVSDVPLGVMLSGGVDSSLVTALMAEASSEPVKTFSVGFREEAAANELSDARHVAGRFGTEHHELLTTATAYPELLDEAIWHLEEPVADLSFMGFLQLSRMAREHVTVALCGQAADELLGGYRKHGVARVGDWVARAPRPLSRAMLWAARQRPERDPLGRALVVAGSRDPADRMLAMSRVVGRRQREWLIESGLPCDQAEEEIRAVVQRLAEPGLPPLEQTLRLDARLALVDLMFLYCDKMSMAASLEVRVPFADHRLVEFCLRAPANRKVWRTRRKELLRRVSRSYVPQEILHKPKRGFFRAAASTWLRENRPYVEEILFDERTRRRGVLRPSSLETLVAGADRDRGRAGEPLLAALMLELWHRQFVDADGPGARAIADARNVSWRA